jgi:hypothetical protein
MVPEIYDHDPLNGAIGRYSMIPKSGYRFSEKIMLKQLAKAKCRLNPK